MKPLRTRYPGQCRSCSRPVPVGEHVLYDVETKLLLCAECVSAGGPAVQSAGARSDGNHLALSALLKTLRGALEDAIPSPVWVRAEVMRWRPRRSGFVNLELAETGAEGAILAQVQAEIPPRERERILRTFELETGEKLREGLTILTRVAPKLDPRFGLSLVVCDVDPSFTLGEHAVATRRILERLSAEGLLDRNRLLPAPKDFTRVAVLAPDQAQGLDDFGAEATVLERAGLCSFDHRPVRFSGPSAAEDLARAVDELGRRHELLPLDAIVLLRGGGAATDLLALNDYRIARSICTCPVPVFTALGHERDQTLLDRVANRAFGTPSKASTHISSTIVSRSRDAGKAWDDLHQIASARLVAERDRVDALWSRVDAYAREQRAHHGRAAAEAEARRAASERGIPAGVALPVLAGAVIGCGLMLSGQTVLALASFFAGIIIAVASEVRRRGGLR